MWPITPPARRIFSSRRQRPLPGRWWPRWRQWARPCAKVLPRVASTRNCDRAACLTTARSERRSASTRARNSERGQRPSRSILQAGCRTLSRRAALSPRDLLRFPLLRLDDWKTWARWFDAAGVTTPVVPGPVLNRASMLIDAVVDGQGVALARTTLAAWDLINGRPVRPIDVSLRLSKMFWIVCPKATSALPKITLFREWLLAEAADDMRRLKALKSG